MTDSNAKNGDTKSSSSRLSLPALPGAEAFQHQTTAWGEQAVDLPSACDWLGERAARVVTPVFTAVFTPAFTPFRVHTCVHTRVHTRVHTTVHTATCAAASDSTCAEPGG